MKAFTKTVAAIALGVAALGFTAASADRGDRDDDRYEQRRDNDRYDDRRDRDRYDDRRDRDRYDDRRDDRRYSDNRSRRPDACRLDHDHRIHHRDYYSFYPRDRYYNADPGFTLSLSFGDRGYYDRGGRYNDRYDTRGYRNNGQVINRDVFNIRGYRAKAIITEEAYYGRRGGYDRVCTVTARGPDARYVPYGQLRSIAARACSRRSDIRIYA